VPEAAAPLPRASAPPGCRAHGMVCSGDLLRRVPGVGTLGRKGHPSQIWAWTLHRPRTSPAACSLVGKPTPCLPSAETPGQPFQTFGQSWGVEPPHSPYNLLTKDRRGSPILHAAVLSRSTCAAVAPAKTARARAVDLAASQHFSLSARFGTGYILIARHGPRLRGGT
jgi:hypothetical protein